MMGRKIVQCVKPLLFVPLHGMASYKKVQIFIKIIPEKDVGFTLLMFRLYILGIYS